IAPFVDRSEPLGLSRSGWAWEARLADFDNDGTPEALQASGIAARVPIDYLRLERNGGGAEGFHYGVREALRSDAGWIWLMDDDCEPAPACLADLLAHPRASDPGAALVAPLVEAPGGDVLPLNRGWLRPRWFRAPLVGLSPEHYERDEVEVDHVSLVGPLVRAELAAREQPPRRDFFIWFDDLEWVSRLRRHGKLWLVPGARIVHKDPRPMASLTLRARWRDFSRGHEFAQSWKRNYGLRNLVWAGRRDGYVTLGRMLSYLAVAAARTLLFESHRARSLRLTARYALDGWRGRFLNLPPAEWPELATRPRPLEFLREHALSYDADVDTPVRPLTGGAR
ncbi:MAG: rhamnopyranosyl-N-acetylglucosaminyl-diphospho-decaprenol beta,3/1,4-galactofuranosyltransferase, partial [Thermoleophilaceae bacterium]|nr:rhamnopyranosyl-N-acetylglucosaminyl-diphospho-decaprenol beta,3/1,4-galactofuranosyltransferase [Thermoleophilaceae bacterium]